jgi:uncharacterized protein YdcH (DUF465 family)
MKGYIKMNDKNQRLTYLLERDFKLSILRDDETEQRRLRNRRQRMNLPFNPDPKMSFSLYDPNRCQTILFRRKDKAIKFKKIIDRRDKIDLYIDAVLKKYPNASKEEIAKILLKRIIDLMDEISTLKNT